MGTTIPAILKTPRCICRAFTEADAEALYKLHSTHEVGSITIDGVQNSEQAYKELQHFITHQQAHGYSLWMVFEKATGRFIGRAGFEYRQIHPDYPPQMEIRYAFFPEAWGKGYATELGQACMDWAWETVKPQMIVATASPVNAPSHRVLEKIGFTSEPDFIYREHGMAFFKAFPPTPNG